MILQKNIIKLKKTILNSEVATKIITNSSWLVGDKVFSMLIGVFVVALVARYLGPETYGEFNFALSFVLLFTAISSLGLETLTVKAIIDNDHEEGTILCTSLFLRVAGGIILTLLATIIIEFIEPNNESLHLVVFILSITMIFKSLEVIEYWIQAYQRSKISSTIRMGASVVSAGLKVFFVIFEGSLLHLALIYMIDVIIIGAALVIAYFIKREKKYKWKFSFIYAKTILSQSWYLILSGLMVTLYMKIDQVMLGAMLPNKSEVGIYSAAVQVASMWYFVPMAIIISFKPVIMSKKRLNEQSYILSVQLLYTIVAWMGIVFGILITLASNIIISTLFGTDYVKAASILTISIWGGIFAMLGTVASTWLVCENLQKYNILLVLGGAISNIVLNFILIPLLGGGGAAIATVATQVVANFVIPLFFREVRLSSIMILRAFVFSGLRKG